MAGDNALRDDVLTKRLGHHTATDRYIDRQTQRVRGRERNRQTETHGVR